MNCGLIVYSALVAVLPSTRSDPPPGQECGRRRGCDETLCGHPASLRGPLDYTKPEYSSATHQLLRFSAMNRCPVFRSCFFPPLTESQERAWYDSHRASLIPEPDAEAIFEEIRKGAPPPRSRDRGLTVRHLTQFFDTTICDGFDDGPNVSRFLLHFAFLFVSSSSVQSFFTIYRHLFERLAHDEKQLVDTPLPSFGDSTWPWLPPSKEEKDACVRTFYSHWTNFVTEKEFEWADQWNIAEAPDRRVRR